jgi:hypothetical protein
MSYTEYLRVVLPVSDQRLRTAATQRPNYDVDILDYLHASVENS